MILEGSEGMSFLGPICCLISVTWSLPQKALISQRPPGGGPRCFSLGGKQNGGCGGPPGAAAAPHNTDLFVNHLPIVADMQFTQLGGA